MTSDRHRQPRKRRLSKARTALLAAVLMVPAIGLVVYAPTLYILFCQATGLGGTVQRADGVTKATPAGAQPQADKPSRTITVMFDAAVGPDLDWEFRPEQRKVTVTPDRPTKIYYYARNRTDETVVARAVFNVTPFKAAPYFFKIECFCFTEEKLGPGESARMPVVLYLDEQLLKDPDTWEVEQVTLFYTFYRARGDAADAKAARDLKSGSEKLEKSLKKKEETRFHNDARRR